MSGKTKHKKKASVASAKPAPVLATPYLQRPLAPAPKLVFLGVCVFTLLLLVGASNLGNDYADAFGCIAVLALAAVVLDFTGRREAAKNPKAIYKGDSLPDGGRAKMKNGMRVLTFFVLVFIVAGSARPGVHASPLPYFLAAAFMFFVIPQAVAWRAVMDFNAGSGPGKAKGKKNAKKR